MTQAELQHHIQLFQENWAIPCPRLAAADAHHAAEYLFEEIVDGPTFTVSPRPPNSPSSSATPSACAAKSPTSRPPWPN